MKKIIIAGDSFASIKLAHDHGWPKLLEQSYNVTHVASPGVGEYKILQQLQKHDLSEFDAIIVSHTSPNRIHCEKNPLYPDDHVYRDSDVIFADAENKQSTVPLAKTLVDYFGEIFDADYYKFIHHCCCEKIDLITNDLPVIHITNFDWTGLYAFDSLLNFYKLWIKNKGDYVHYNQSANQHILKSITKKIEST
jgi:hypothetical protein